MNQFSSTAAAVFPASYSTPPMVPSAEGAQARTTWAAYRSPFRFVGPPGPRRPPRRRSPGRLPWRGPCPCSPRPRQRNNNPKGYMFFPGRQLNRRHSKFTGAPMIPERYFTHMSKRLDICIKNRTIFLISAVSFLSLAMLLTILAK